MASKETKSVEQIFKERTDKTLRELREKSREDKPTSSTTPPPPSKKRAITGKATTSKAQESVMDKAIQKPNETPPSTETKKIVPKKVFDAREMTLDEIFNEIAKDGGGIESMEAIPPKASK